MTTLFLIPPSEGKLPGGNLFHESLSFSFQKPSNIAANATEKDLKCTGKRYEEGIQLNRNIERGPCMKAMERYDGVMFDAINYNAMSDKGQQFFDEHFVILSGMYGMVLPGDIIGNYKLPIETRGLANYWKENITHAINSMDFDCLVNLLPLSYMKMIDWKRLKMRIVHIRFIEGEKSLSHNVKKTKGEWIHVISEKTIQDYKMFGGEFEEAGNNVFITIRS